MAETPTPIETLRWVIARAAIMGGTDVPLRERIADARKALGEMKAVVKVLQKIDRDGVMVVHRDERLAALVPFGKEGP